MFQRVHAVQAPSASTCQQHGLHQYRPQVGTCQVASPAHLPTDSPFKAKTHNKIKRLRLKFATGSATIGPGFLRRGIPRLFIATRSRALSSFLMLRCAAAAPTAACPLHGAWACKPLSSDASAPLAAQRLAAAHPRWHWLPAPARQLQLQRFAPSRASLDAGLHGNDMGAEAIPGTFQIACGGW